MSSTLPDFQALLRGEINTHEYVLRVREDVDALLALDSRDRGPDRPSPVRCDPGSLAAAEGDPGGPGGTRGGEA